MKTLKRSLSLLLVLALCLGCMTAAFATSFADYPDADEVTYKEAMDLLVAIGVIQGTDGGELDPDGYVTRESAAKMIAYIRLGKTAAEALSKTTGSFDDVESGRWSAGYIAYCVSAGIINGRNSNTFDPTGKVTAYEFVKMLLCAVGYGANDELTGSDWAINTATTGFNVGAFDDSKATSYNDPATREEAMLYAFNVLTKAMTVKYSSAFDSYYSGSSPLTSIDEDDEYLYTLGYKTFGIEKEEDIDDGFGRLYYVWEQDGEAITESYYATPTLSYTTTVTSGALYTALGSAYAGTATYFVDGVEQEDGFDIVKNRTTDFVGGRGTQTFVYADTDTKDVVIVCICTYLALVNDVDDDTVTVTVYDDKVNNGCDGEDASGEYDFETTGFEDDDYVLVTIADGEVMSMTAAASKNGVMDSYASAYTKVDGTSYYVNATCGALDTAEDEGDYTSTYTFFFDSYGYLLGNVLYSAADADADYIYVDSCYADYRTTKSTSLEIGVTYMDGAEDVLNVYVNSSNKFYNGSAYVTINKTGEQNSSGSDYLADGFYRYTKNSDGTVNLKAVSTSSKPAVAVLNGYLDVTSASKLLYAGTNSTYTNNGTGKYLNSSTVLTIIDTKNDKVTTVTGYSNIKGYNLDEVQILYVYSGSIVTEIYVVGGSAQSSSLYAYYTGSSYTDNDGTWYTFYIEGSSVSYLIDESSTVTAPVAYNLYDVSISGDEINLGSAAANTNARAKVTTAKSLYFKTANGTVYYDDDVEVYDATNSGAAATVSVGDYVVYAVENGLAVAVYITPAPASSGSTGSTATELTVSAATLTSSQVGFTTNGVSGDTVYVVVYKWNGTNYVAYYEYDETLTTATSYSDANGGTYEDGRYKVVIYSDSGYTDILTSAIVTLATD